MREKQNLLGASVIDWAATEPSFWACAHVFTSNFSFPVAILIFAATTLAGLLSFLPMGVGSSDLTVAALCARLGLDTNQVLLGLVLYHVFYYIVPQLLAAIVWVVDNVKRLEPGFPHHVMAWVLTLATVFSSLLPFISVLTPEIVSRI